MKTYSRSSKKLEERRKLGLDTKYGTWEIRESSKMEQKQRNIFLEGQVVEVGSEEEGLRDSWYLATVVKLPSPSPSSSSSSSEIEVEYHSLFTDELGTKPLVEQVNLSLVRPSPPPWPSPSFEVDDLVDAYYRDGWWTGVITQLVGSSRFVVTFSNPPDVVEFGMSDLRFHLHWIDGKWVPPQKHQRKTGSIFSRGKKVEVCFGNEKKGEDVWFPATVMEETGNDSFLVEMFSQEEEGPPVKEIVVDSLHIRPSPPNLKVKNFVALDKVDAFYDFGWWSGVITKEVGDNKYVILFKHTNEERELNHSELRPHMEWRDGNWFSASRRRIWSPEDGVRRITPLPNLFSTLHKDGSDHHHNQGTHAEKPSSRPSKRLKAENTATETLSPKACQLNSAIKITGISNNNNDNDDDNNNDNINKNNISSKQKAVDLSADKPDSLSQREEVEGNEFGGGSSSKQNKRRGRPPKLLAVKKVNRVDGGLKTKSLKDELIGSPASGGDKDRLFGRGSDPLKAKKGNKKVVVEKKINPGGCGSSSIDDDLPLSAWLEGVCSQTQTPIINASSKKKNVEESREGEQKVVMLSHEEEGGGETAERKLPFVKSPSLWRAIESLEVFERMPQKPHFRDLESVSEIYREGLAVACMVNFSCLVKNVERLELEDPISKIEGHLKTLEELQGHGFDVKVVRDRLNQLLVVKDREEDLQKQYKQVEYEIGQHNQEKSKIVEKCDDVMKQLRELEEMHARVLAKKEKEESEIASLESKVEGINDAITNNHREYVEALANVLF